VIAIEKDGGCKILNSPKFVENDPEWNNLLQKRVNDILNSL